MPATPEALESSLIEFIARELINDPEAAAEVTAEDDLLASGLVDSLGVMRLIRHLEETYGVTVPAADVTLENFMTVSAVAGYLGELRTSGANG
ncbi:MAG: acyl carrier protein [Acidobacteriota bacterium]